tara:strand:- start:248 stop:412 length:165 start_codon:yes stop_codon:yes gene_type:complete
MNFIFRYFRKKILQDMEEQINAIIDERWGMLNDSMNLIHQQLVENNSPPWRELE